MDSSPSTFRAVYGPPPAHIAGQMTLEEASAIEPKPVRRRKLTVKEAVARHLHTTTKRGPVDTAHTTAATRGR